MSILYRVFEDAPLFSACPLQRCTRPVILSVSTSSAKPSRRPRRGGGERSRALGTFQILIRYEMLLQHHRDIRVQNCQHIR